MIKNNLNTGYIVKLRNNQFMMVMETENNGVILIGENESWNQLYNYHNNLMHSANRDFDIMEVYGFTEVGCRALEISDTHRELLWKRKEKREMTVSEIEAILGYEVEIISEEGK